jgi:hypothetical protein
MQTAGIALGQWPEIGYRSEEHRAAVERVQQKKEIIQQLIGGRLALLEATARFGALTKGPRQEGEQLCRQVIGWAHLALCDWPEKAEACSERLERELQAHLARHGAVQLPCA